MLDASTPVSCEPYHCTLPAGACALRAVVLAPGKRAASFRYPTCARCPVGAERLEQLVRAGWELPENLRNLVRPDQRQQIAAKQRYYRTRVWSEFVPAQFSG